MPDVVAWVSPQDDYQTFDAVIADLATVRAAFPDRSVRVAIPTAYGAYLQGQMERPTYRVLGDELCPATIIGYDVLRQRFEDAGYPCDGWSVPRGNTPSDRGEGALHGTLACLFPRFYINFEAGWDGFWTKPSDVQAANDWLGGYWSAAGATPTGLTWVTNSMLAAVPDDAKRAWIDGTNFDLLEAYVPYDANLDPDRAVNIWAGVLGRLGAPISRPIYVMVEKAIARYVQGPHPVHLWTLASTHAQCAALAANQPEPTPMPTPDPTPTPAPDYRVALADVTAPTGEIVPALLAAKRLTSVKAMRPAVQAVADRLAAINTEFQP